MTKLLGIAVTNGLSSENQVFANLLAARDSDYDATVIIHEDGGDDVAERFRRLAGCTTIPLDTGWRRSSWKHRGNPARALVALRYRRSIGTMTRAARNVHADVVYSSQQHYDVRAATAIASAIDRPQIIHLHYTVGPWLRIAALDRLRTADHVVAVSDFIRRQAIEHGVPAERVTTIHNTVRPFATPDATVVDRIRTEIGAPTGRFVFGMVGRIDEGKGHLDAIDAIEHVRAQGHDAALVIVGSGRIEHEVRTRAAESPALDRITFLGQRNDIADLLPAFDCLLHPATADPCPLAVLEAMAAARPVIGYDDGGVPEQVAAGITGLLVGHRDVGALAEAMSQLCRSPGEGTALGLAGAQRLATVFAPREAGARFAQLVVSIAQTTRVG